MLADFFKDVLNVITPRHEFMIIGTDFEYTKFTGVITSFVYAPEVHDDTEAKATVGDVELIETGNLLTPQGSDELPQISI